MRNNKPFGIGAKGYYIALILCAAAIGISGYVYHQNENKAEEVTLLDYETTVPAETVWTEDVEALATVPATIPSTAAPKAATEPTVRQSAGRPLKTASPLKGDSVGGYSMDCLSYNETTRDWRVHNGVDIAAEEGTPVCAAADGTVTEVMDDDVWGTTVVIRHDGGYTTQYASLQENPSVKPGDKVTLGQSIGCVGTTALVETAMGSHLHFSVSYQNMPMDPQDFFKLAD